MGRETVCEGVVRVPKRRGYLRELERAEDFLGLWGLEFVGKKKGKRVYLGRNGTAYAIVGVGGKYITFRVGRVTTRLTLQGDKRYVKRVLGRLALLFGVRREIVPKLTRRKFPIV